MIPVLGKLFAGKGGEIAKEIIGGVDALFTSKEEKLEKQIQLTEVLNKHMAEMAEITQRETEAYLKDVDSARQMQIEALKQQDTFSKRFVYYLAAFLIFATFGFDMCFFFVTYPEKNHDILNMTAGVINSLGFAGVVQFFFGSSKSSEKKQETIEGMAKKYQG